MNRRQSIRLLLPASALITECQLALGHAGKKLQGVSVRWGTVSTKTAAHADHKM